MKSMLALTWILFVPALSQAANIAEYCLEGVLVNFNTNVIKSSLKCNIAQKLTWEDYTALFKCNFDGQIESIFTNATEIGSYQGTSIAWTIYDLKNSKSGQFLANGLKLSGIKNSQDIKIMYSDKVWANDKFVVVEDRDGIYKLNLKAYLGKCK